MQSARTKSWSSVEQGFTEVEVHPDRHIVYAENLGHMLHTHMLDARPWLIKACRVQSACPHGCGPLTAQIKQWQHVEASSSGRLHCRCVLLTQVSAAKRSAPETRLCGHRWLLIPVAACGLSAACCLTAMHCATDSAPGPPAVNTRHSCLVLHRALHALGLDRLIRKVLPPSCSWGCCLLYIQRWASKKSSAACSLPAGVLDVWEHCVPLLVLQQQQAQQDSAGRWVLLKQES